MICNNGHELESHCHELYRSSWNQDTKHFKTEQKLTKIPEEWWAVLSNKSTPLRQQILLSSKHSLYLIMHPTQQIPASSNILSYLVPILRTPLTSITVSKNRKSSTETGRRQQKPAVWKKKLNLLQNGELAPLLWREYAQIMKLFTRKGWSASSKCNRRSSTIFSCFQRIAILSSQSPRLEGRSHVRFQTCLSC